MNVVIIEDEPQAAQRLERLVKELISNANILAKMDTVKKSVAWFKGNTVPDLVLMDIQLADGISFEIFEHCDIKAPIIFTTAYDEYALKAFKVNSIDYILKPVDKDELGNALKKLKTFTGNESQTQQMLDNIGHAVQMLMKKYKNRFVIKVGEHLKTIEVSAIRYFFSQDKTTFCVTEDNRNFILDYTLEQLEELVDPAQFFRINRKYLVSSPAIQDIINYTNSRLRLVLKGSQDNEVIVARERVQEFKDWLDR
ncbi:LytR/AlgR family response regulator transcription factor [Chryseosolibacter indicus]|uniref:LytTR family DNA-binding domain-containing protein n=1 Tax=Chryseosolibacter indicus TaxID=2782351 RepID=A0ABS5VTH1_9BACT|nr:LytTR family DNA-binding domain-containing protein [Chryseosolibacter indicus]MBT1704702.1 LytTR family DNA-binding domain-containing protein [Chryseosolibacter indicus]